MRQFLFFLLFCLTLVARPYNEFELQRVSLLKQDTPFSFAVMGDNRDGDDILAQIIKKLNKSDILFAINNGDLSSNGDEDELKEYIDILKHSKKPILSNIGNHDIPFFFDDKSNYKHYVGKPYYSFIFANSYFIFVDNANKIRVGKEQIRWLTRELKKSQDYKYRFIFIHVPLFDPREGTMRRGHSMKDVQNAKKLSALFDKYNVTMIFASHIHAYFKGRWGRTPFIITGGAGAPHIHDDGFYHYIVVKVTKDSVKYLLKRL